ncbi:MAG: hypothetical protein JWM54_1226 [Acidobacteriaceae bacterium]|jgi:hypothetical protein|nr:hypothetical protein [Acidobacteriaceae bacterium]
MSVRSRTKSAAYGSADPDLDRATLQATGLRKQEYPCRN